MPTVGLDVILNDARNRKYAVGGFAISNLDFIDCLVDSAIEENSPIILQLAEAHFKYLGLEKIVPAILNVARNVNIPICIHLDHGQSLKTVIKAIRAGFNSVMFDGSHSSFDENIRLTKEVVSIAHAAGISVEGEIGYIGGESAGFNVKSTYVPKKENFTKVEEAYRFARETKVDALAISVGNAHGFYKDKPNLDFERIAEIQKAIDVPLVLHGGSGISEENFKKAIQVGICKINYYTDMSVVAVNKLRDFLALNQDFNSYPDLIKIAMAEVKNHLKEIMKIFGSSNKFASDKTACFLCNEGSCSFINPELAPSNNILIYSDLIEKISSEVIKCIKK